jgi:hypothetical protein
LFDRGGGDFSGIFQTPFWVLGQRLRYKRRIMPRQIICEKCGTRPPGNYPGEQGKRVKGRARFDFVCDLCNEGISEGTPCLAQTFSNDRQPYGSWENEYIAKEALE